MEKILITGASGFIGQEIIKKLISKEYLNKYQIHVLERYVTGRYSLDSSPNIIKHYGNLTDYPVIRNIVREIKPDYCIHLAAISAVSFSYDHFLEVNETNYLGSINLFEALYREVPDFKHIIVAGTSEEYGMTLQDINKKLNENSDLYPNSPYAVSKVAISLYLKYMSDAYQFKYIILRPFNTYGRKDNTHFFIERTITQMLLEKDKIYLGDPTSVRDWLYIEDHVNGYIKALTHYSKAINQTIQLCTGKGYTTKETAEFISKLTKFKGEIIWNSTPSRPLDAKILIGDNTKAKNLLDWEPKYNLEEGLNKTIDYWKIKK